MLQIGVIGYGYWEPNIMRNFIGADDARVAMVCDRSLRQNGKMVAL
jgi:predicted dehydrogenase